MQMSCWLYEPSLSLWSPYWEPGSACFTQACLTKCLGRETPACMHTLSSSSLNTRHGSVSLTVLAPWTWTPILHQLAFFLESILHMLNIVLPEHFFHVHFCFPSETSKLVREIFPYPPYRTDGFLCSIMHRDERGMSAVEAEMIRSFNAEMLYFNAFWPFWHWMVK